MEEHSPIGKSRLRVFPLLTISAFCVPILLGLAGTWLPAFGYLPAIGAEDFSLHNFRELFAHPAYSGALRASIISGFGATLLALCCSIWITISIYGSSLWRLLVRLLSALLAVPHAAFAIGFTFLVAPSGLLIRCISPELTGFVAPPDWLTVKDPYGLSLTLALALKEIPFLLLMCISGLNQLDIRRTAWIGRSLGYSQIRIWTRLVLPRLYPQLRLPVLAVLAYSLSVVDVAIILGPSLPPTLAVLVDRWFNDPDVMYRLLGAAGATWLFLLVACSIGLFLAAEKLITLCAGGRLISGSRATVLDNFRWLGNTLAVVLLGVSTLCFVVLLIWSLARNYRFPDLLPTVYTLRFWLKGLVQAAEPLYVTFVVGALATCVGGVLVTGCLEYEVRLRQMGRRADSQKIMWLVYLPLLVPQIAFLFGIQTSAVLLHLEGKWLSMVGIHLVFVLPYIFLTLSNVYRNFDARYIQVAVALSGSPLRSFFRVKLPILLKPVAFALATGFAVSVAQYLPTMYMGAGRFMTITTETVSLASGSDRRVIAVYALCQFLLPLLVYCLAIFLPAWLFRQRRAMQN
jgi:putative thiamine transport system permease protein